MTDYRQEGFRHSASPTPIYRKQPKKPKKRSIYDYQHITTERKPIVIDQFLVEQKFDVPTTAIQTQTAPFLDHVSEDEEFVPVKQGVDCGTQIDTSLVFDFDQECIPLVDLIVSKTMEQSLLEVRHEEEIAFHKNRKLNFQQTNARIRHEMAAKEQQAQEKLVQLRKLKEQESRRVEEEVEALANQVLNESMDQVYAKLEADLMDQLDAQGYFPDVHRELVKNEFLPWLMQATDAHVQDVKLGRSLVTAMILHTVEHLKAAARAKDESLRAALVEVVEVEDEGDAPKASVLRLCVNGMDLSNIQDGADPYIEISPSDTVGEVEEKILQWLQEHSDAQVTAPEGGFLSIACNDGESLDYDRTVEELDCEDIAIPFGAAEPTEEDEDDSGSQQEDGFDGEEEARTITGEEPKELEDDGEVVKDEEGEGEIAENADETDV